MDESFLGNTYLGGHSLSNGSRNSVHRRWVYHNSVYYLSKANNNIGIEPGVTSGWEDYWTPLSGPDGAVDIYGWGADTLYYKSLAFSSEGVAQKAAIFGFYTESGQGPVAISPRSMWIGGTNGAGMSSKDMVGGG